MSAVYSAAWPVSKRAVVMAVANVGELELYGLVLADRRPNAERSRE